MCIRDRYVGNSRLLGHNADYDYHILNFNLHRYLPDIQLEERCNMYFDSLKLIRLLEPNPVSYTHLDVYKRQHSCVQSYR